MAKLQLQVDHGATFKSLTFLCVELGAEVIDESPSWWAESQECDLCGSHETVSVSVSCECSVGRHEIVVYSS